MTNKTPHVRAGAAVRGLLKAGFASLAVSTDDVDEDGPIVRIEGTDQRWEVVVSHAAYLAADTRTYDWMILTHVDDIAPAIRFILSPDNKENAL
jgi:hypothetical protein